jgi:hypothetical protein
MKEDMYGKTGEGVGRGIHQYTTRGNVDARYTIAMYEAQNGWAGRGE